MQTNNAQAQWKGSLKEGSGKMKLGSGSYEGEYSFATRFENKGGTNPDELVGAALAGCYSMAMSLGLEGEGFTPNSIDTKAEVDFGLVDGHPKISQIRLNTKADIPGINNEQFQQIAEATKKGCPVSQALSGVDIQLEAELIQ